MRHENAPDRDGLSPPDRRLVETIAAHYRPEPMNPVRQAAFRRRLAARVVHDAQPRWMPALTLAGAAAAVLVWFVLLGGDGASTSDGVARSASDTSMLYAFVDPDRSSESTQRTDFLPDDYAQLASALDVPVDDL
jgi:hypothetical protein